MRIVSFESRKAADMVNLIERRGGQAISAPTMRELPLEHNGDALNFAQRLLAGEVDLLILLTGVGTRMLVDAMATEHPREALVEALARTVIMARGPKPVAALREMGLRPAFTVPEPNTWQDLLSLIDAHDLAANNRVAVQEYGITNEQLVDGLRQRKAEVTRVPVYRWGLPEDLEPMKAAIDAVIAGEVDIAVFTSATQVHHLFQVADEAGKAEKLREGFKRVCIGSVGPVASENLQKLGLSVDYEPDAPHMPQLIGELARRGRDLVAKKRVALAHGVDTNGWRRTDMVWLSPGDVAAGAPTIEDSVMMKACRREPTPYTPIWLMRQAGRYQREYREIRAKISMLDLCKTPELAAEVTLMAVDRLGVDAGIIFADILLPVEAMGLQLEFAAGEGPVIHNPIRSRHDIDRLPDADVAELDYVYEAIKLTRQALRPDLALIGFAGAPFTVASYVIEGGKSKMYQRTKAMMADDPATWHDLMDRLVSLTGAYLNRQIAAGADVVQLFDSWVGALSPDDYRTFVLPHTKAVIDGVKVEHRETPVIHFGTGNPALLPLMNEAGGDVIGLDWRCDLADAWRTLGPDVAVMGNLDPTILYTTPRTIRQAAARILEKAAGRPGHIFNLGHGIMPDMNPQHVADLVDAVHELSAG